MRRELCTVAILMLLGVSGCSAKAPGCAEKRTADLVVELSGRHVTVATLQRTGFKVSLESIRTIGADRQTGAQFCAAALVLKSPYQQQTVEIEYKSENTDSGEQYVTIYGL